MYTLLFTIRGVFTSSALLMTALSKLYEMTIGIAQEGPYLVAPIDWRREEFGSARAQHLVSGIAVRYANVNSLLTVSGLVGGAKVTVGLSLVGLPPTVSNNWLPPKLRRLFPGCASTVEG
jgi:hypothetical protein